MSAYTEPIRAAIAEDESRASWTESQLHNRAIERLRSAMQ